MTTITLNPRELWSLAIGGAALCFITGVLMACLTIAVFVLPMQDERTAHAVDRAYTKGAMVKIASSKARCQEWALRANRAICE